jgi:transketolase
MRSVFCQSMIKAASRPDFVFLTGDLGYKALEPLRDVLGSRFINAGVAEQNMISLAAGLARSQMRPWVYSIAPFVYARPFEQVRNDLSLHNLPVVLVGNGGGYGYGVMGATHHALEDYGTLLCLPHLRVYIPAFNADVEIITEQLFSANHPCYLRLGVSEEPKDSLVPTYAPWRKLVDGLGWVIIVTGSLVGSLWTAIRELQVGRRPSLWLVSELPVETIPIQFNNDVFNAGRLLVVEEHVTHGGLAEHLALRLLSSGNAPRQFVTRAALGYPSGLYGSQLFHRRECGLDPTSILNFLETEG